MTEPSEFAQADDLLPGLDPPRRGESAMVRAARRTIAALSGDGYLDESHAILCQQILELAEVVDAGRRQGKASAVAMAAAQIIATYEKLVPESAGGSEDDAAWSELVAEFRRSAAPVRDSPQSGTQE